MKEALDLFNKKLSEAQHEFNKASMRLNDTKALLSPREVSELRGIKQDAFMIMGHCQYAIQQLSK